MAGAERGGKGKNKKSPLHSRIISPLSAPATQANESGTLITSSYDIYWVIKSSKLNTDFPKS